ncbi:MAG TPA: thermonuclease family protein [Solirubrobacteraceae bacterium]|nr:thermonuclease family protein [Solirubrobacteraceae bacterium]
MKRTPAPLRPTTTPGAAPKRGVAQTSEQPGERLGMGRVLLLVSAVAALMGMPASDAAAHSVDRDCSEFGSQAVAQEHFDRHAGDPDRLDDDEDGTACEELPCPCGFVVVPPPPEPARPARGPLPWPLTTKARVAGVIDANTLKVRLSAGEMINVRLIGVDSPTRRGAGSRGECGAQDATARMKRLAFRDGVGRIVELRTDPMWERKGESDRLRAYVGVAGVDFGRAMITSGWAKVHPPNANFLRASTYRKAEASAKAAKRGLWRRCGDSTRVR